MGYKKVRLSKVFRALRNIALDDMGYSNITLAKELEVNHTNLSRWSHGSDGREPSLSVVRALAALVGRALVFLPDRILVIPLRAGRVLAGYHDEEGEMVEEDEADEEVEDSS